MGSSQKEVAADEDAASVCAKLAKLSSKANIKNNFFIVGQVRDSALTLDSDPSCNGFSLISRMKVLSAVNVHHNSTMKNVKKITNEITGQMATLSML